MPDRSVAPLLDLLLKANRLKTVPRAGWALRGVASPESVAAHAHGTALVALLMLEIVGEALDRARVLAMAVLHDLPECVTGDLPHDAARLLPPGAKAAAERAALDELLGGLAFAGSWREAWREYDEGRSREALLVRDADRLDMLAQALAYETACGNRALDEFWDGIEREPLAFLASRELAAALARRRPARG